MRTSEVELLIIPGWGNSGPDHWQSRWQHRLKTARRVEQADWDTPLCADWVGRIIDAVARASEPVVLIAHSLGATAAVHAISELPPNMVTGAFLVAAPDLDGADIWPAKEGGFAPVPKRPLPCPSVLIASTNDPYCSFERAKEFAGAWGATLLDAGAAGHINTDSGHGPWPEGLMQLGLFLKGLKGPLEEAGPRV